MQNPLFLITPIYRENNYEYVKNLGKGAYGRVDAAKHKKTGKVFAKKTMEFMQLAEFGIPSNALREVSLLKELDHPNVVKVEEVIYTVPKLHLFMEYMETDLKKYIEEQKPISNSKIQYLMKQILWGVVGMHSSSVIHRDIKPENIFLDHDESLKIGDFGISRTLSVSSKPMSPEVVTIFYRAPELALGVEGYSIPIDVWSVGWVFAELFLGSPLFIVDSEIDLLTKIFKAKGTPTEETWPGISSLISSVMPKYPQKNIQIDGMDDTAVDLLNKMLTPYPLNRINAKEALLHPYFEMDYS